ncbi:hypothetical protein FRB95_000852 [Tulasnella sp. JGI-2019a]|nr:hypothetical protein FRB95_000852 [Tulasnella sp. JGI-2019a]
MATNSCAIDSFYNGNKVPVIGYGTASNTTNVVDPVLTALSAGFTHLDTAEIYGTEESVGIAVHKYLSEPSTPARDSIFIATKFYKALEPGQTVKERLQESLKKLDLDYVDLYLIHTPVSHPGKLKGIWKQMEGVQKEGLAKNIGVSNFRIKDYKDFIADAEILPVCNQIEFNPHLLNATEPLLAFQEKYGIRTASYGGLNPLTKHKTEHMDAALRIVRERYSKDLGVDISDEQILIKWTFAKGVLPVTMSSKKERLFSMIKSVELPDLERSDVDIIDEAGRKEHRRAYQLHMDD